MSPVVTCARCERNRTHWARGLCSPCYSHLRQRDRGALAGYRPVRSAEMHVDEVMIDRAISWLGAIHRTVPHRRLSAVTGRPDLTRGEQIEVMRRTEGRFSRSFALRALGTHHPSVKDARNVAHSEGEGRAEK